MNLFLRRLGILACVIYILAPLTLHAAPVLRSGDSIDVAETQTVDGDFYVAGGTVTIAGDINGDVHAAGGAVTIDGSVKQDVVVAGGSISINGPVGDDVRAFGGEIFITGTVRGDVLVFGGTVQIASTAHIYGDVLFFAGEANAEGVIDGSVLGRAESVHINGQVLGAVSVSTVRVLELGDQAHIDGSIEYWSALDLVRAPGSVVVGDITKRAAGAPQEEGNFNILPILALFFTSLAYVLLFKTKLVPVMQHTITGYGKHILVGIGTFILTPLVVLLLLISGIGLPLGLVLLLLYILSLVLAGSLSGVLFGAVLARRIDGQVTISTKWTLLGTLLFAILWQLPYVGGVAVILVNLVIIGSLVTMLYRWIRR